MRDEKRDEKQVSFFERESVRKNTDIITDMLDRQAIENIRALQERRNYEEELLASLHKLNSHSLCPGSLPTCDDLKKDVMKKETVKEEVKEEAKEEVHGADCHCSKCCPNPNPNFFQRHKTALLIGVIFLALLVFAVGWSPSGPTAEAINTSWVELIVDFFKMGVFAIAGIATYNLVKKSD